MPEAFGERIAASDRDRQTAEIDTNHMNRLDAHGNAEIICVA
jgi:hypothetical protein